VWRTREGFSVLPYYRTEDLKGLKYLGVGIGEFPYVRSTCRTNHTQHIATIGVGGRAISLTSFYVLAAKYLITFFGREMVKTGRAFCTK
jgi:hypothetical protein